MSSKKEHKEDYNGEWVFGDHDYARVQWYPGARSYYIIFNDNPAMQTTATFKDLKELIKKFSWTKV